MKILVTGSEGTLGRPLVAELRRRGHSVHGTDRIHSADQQFTRADVSAYRQLEEAFNIARPDVVYHLAAEFGRHNGEGWYEDLWRTAAIGTRNVLELCKHHGALLLFASSSEIYGECEETWLAEELDQTPLWQPNEYALSKWVNERQVVNFQRRYGLRAVRLRFFNAYGPGEQFHRYRSVVCQFCHRALAGEPLTVYSNYHRAFMFIDDFIPTLANACDAHLRDDVYNIGGTDYRSVEDLADIVLAEVGGGSIETIPEDLHNTRSKHPAIDRARRDLGHEPSVRLEEGVPVTLAWMREQLNYPERLEDYAY